MGNALMRRGGGSGVVPGVAGLLIPGLGQLINGEGDKALGMFSIWAIAGLGIVGAIPVVGWLAGGVVTGMHIVGGVDGYVRGRKKR